MNITRQTPPLGKVRPSSSLARGDAVLRLGRQRLDLQHTGHYGVARKMTLKKPLIERDVLDRHGPLTGLVLDHPIHQGEGIAAG